MRGYGILHIGTGTEKRERQRGEDRWEDWNTCSQLRLYDDERFLDFLQEAPCLKHTKIHF